MCIPWMTVAQRALLCLSGPLTLVMLIPGSACAQAGRNELPIQDNDIQEPVRIVAAAEQIWDAGNGVSVHAFRGGARLTQGHLQLTGHNIIVFEERTANGYDLRVVAESSRASPALFEYPGQRRYAPTHAVRLQSINSVESLTENQQSLKRPDPVMRDALPFAFPGTPVPDRGISLSVERNPWSPSVFPGPSQEFVPSRRIQVRPRSSQPLELKSFVTPDTVPAETVYVITGGVNVLVEGAELSIGGQLVRPVIDLSADRVVIWTEGSGTETGAENVVQGMPLLQSANTRFQVYLEGNILVRHRQNTITATHGFVDADNERALLLNAELRAFVPETGGEFRVRAERLRQLAADRFHAQNAWTTTSPYGRPGYRIEASNILVEPSPQTSWTGIDPLTGRINNDPPPWVTMVNTRLLFGDIPLLALPRISFPAEDPGIPVRRASVRHDRVLGLQVRTVWDLKKIFSTSLPESVEWDLLADVYSLRGPVIGTQSRYNVINHQGQMKGEGKAVFLQDDGTDNLGLDRRVLVPEDNQRGQIIWRHHQRLRSGTSLFGEIGYLSDRNYLEQYDEVAFDEGKDVETLAGIRHDDGAFSGTLLVRPGLTELETTTEWLPRADVYSFSAPLSDGIAYWSSHTSAGYAHLDPARPPTDPADLVSPGLLGTPWLRDADGLVLMSRHRLDAPFMLGPVNFNPFVMGEAAFWDKGLMANDIGRFLVNAGIRASLSATKVMPFIKSRIFNLNGLTHKSNTSLEYSFTDVSRNLGELALYNEIDEDAQERFRNRAVMQVFGGLLRPQFDPRFYVVRSGAGTWVTAPWHELAEDQQVVRLRWRNRLQTKTGPCHNPRIRDWMLWEAGVSHFPETTDNFGESFGLLYGNYRWNVSDRASLLADGVWDFFENSQNYWNVGLLSQRSTRGSVYVSYRHVEAENFLQSEIVSASYSYQLSPKWISTAAVAFDVAENQSRGSSMMLSRVGLDFIVHFGFGIDTSKDNVGIAFSIEPRFGPSAPTSMPYLLGLQTR